MNQKEKVVIEVAKTTKGIPLVESIPAEIEKETELEKCLD